MSKQNPRPVVPGTPSSHAFSKVAQAEIQRSAFDLSHSHKTTINPGYLYPLGSYEVYPGDTFTINPTIVAQMLSLKQQLMDSLYLDVHYWFEPNRLVLDAWPLLMGERSTPDQSIDVAVPVVAYPMSGGWPEGSIYDYFGLPTQVDGGTGTLPVSCLRFRAYNDIYNNWYRDQNLIDSVPVPKGLTPADDPTYYELLKRGKRKDAFTSALPWPQKGTAAAVPLSVTGTGPVTLTGAAFPTTTYPVMRNWNDGAVYDPSGTATLSVTPMSGGRVSGLGTDPQNPLVYDPGDTLVAQFTAATSMLLNSFRDTAALQQVLERDARGGTRYPEMIHSHFGVISPDARMQRPEYLGGGTIPVQVHSVVNTNQASGSTLGNRAAYGYVQSSGGLGFTQSFTEHGHIICIVSIRQEYTYQQGLHKSWTRLSRPQYYLPALANLGEEAILRREIVAEGNGHDLEAFGYQERWYDLRWMPSYVTGKFRSNATGTLDSWHLAQDIDPGVDGVKLVQDFIEENPPTDRVVNVPDEPIFQLDMFTSVRAVRPLPIMSTPGLRII